MYLTFYEYEKMGGTLKVASFERYEHKARTIIDLKTFGRVQNESPVRDSVKFACFDLIQAMSANEAATGGAELAVAAMSNDGVSVTFAGAKSAGARYADIVKSWLANETTDSGTPLMYAGVDA